MLKKILLSLVSIIVVCVIGFAVVVAMQPAEFGVSRSATMKAPRSEVFAQINDLRRWEAWSPWAKLDPNAEVFYEGPSAGTGAVFGWSGNDEIGAGKMTITESKPDELIRMRLEFTRPMEDSADTEFTFAAEGDGSVVTWTMSGENNFVAKAICMFMDMDAMVGAQFEEGLKNIKTIVEGEDDDEDKEENGEDGGGEEGAAEDDGEG